MFWPRMIGYSDKTVSFKNAWYMCQYSKYIPFQFPHITHHPVSVSDDLQHHDRGAKEIIKDWEGKKKKNTSKSTAAYESMKPAWLGL